MDNHTKLFYNNFLVWFSKEKELSKKELSYSQKNSEYRIFYRNKNTGKRVTHCTIKKNDNSMITVNYN